MIAGVLETQFTANLTQLRQGIALAEKELRAFEKRAAAVVNIGARGGSNLLPGGRNIITPALDQKIIYNNAAMMQAQVAATNQLISAITRLSATLGPLQAQMARVGQTTQNVNNITNNITRTYQRLPNQIRQSQNAFVGLRASIMQLGGAYAAIRSAQGVKDLLDSTNRIQNALRVVGHEGEELTKVYDRLFDSAQKNYTSVEALSTLYSRLGLAQNELGKTSEEILQFTDRIALALRVQGTTAQEARGALIQLTQAMGSGIVRAEEFNSIVEGAPSILRAAARGISEAGGSVAKLRKMVIDGELSSKAFFDGFMAGSRDLGNLVSRNALTIDQAMSNLNNALTRSVGELDKVLGISKRTTTGIDQLSTSIASLTDYLVSNADSINAFFDNLGGFADGITEGTAKEIETLKGLWTNYTNFLDNIGYTEAMRPVAGAINDAIDPAAAALRNLEADAKAAREELYDLSTSIWIDPNSIIDPIIGERFADLLVDLEEGRITAEKAKQEIANLGGVSPDFAAATANVNAMIDRLTALTTAALQAKAAIGFKNIQAWSQGALDSIPGVWDSLVSAAQGPIKPINASDTTPDKMGGKGKKAKTPKQQFDEELARMRDRIKLIDQETASVGMLNSVQETNRVRQELINAAREKGIKLTPEVLEDIEDIAAAYGKSTQALDDANRALQMQMDLYNEFGSAIGDALGAIISGSEDAERALAKMVLQMIQAVIQAQILNTIGQTNPGVGNMFSQIIGGIFGGFKAEGGPVSAGTAYVVGEKGPELMVPKQNGMIIPNHAAFTPASAQSGYINVSVSSVVENGNLVPLITEVSGQVAGQAIKQSENNIGTTMMKQRLSRRPGIK